MLITQADLKFLEMLHSLKFNEALTIRRRNKEGAPLFLYTKEESGMIVNAPQNQVEVTVMEFELTHQE